MCLSPMQNVYISLVFVKISVNANNAFNNIKTMIDIFSTITLGTRAIFAFCHHRWPNADIIHGKTIIMEVSVHSLQLVKWISFHLLFHESIIHYHQTAEYLCTVEKNTTTSILIWLIFWQSRCYTVIDMIHIITTYTLIPSAMCPY